LLLLLLLLFLLLLLLRPVSAVAHDIFALADEELLLIVFFPRFDAR